MSDVAVGVGTRSTVTADEIVHAVRAIAGADGVRCLATVDRRAEHPAVIAAAQELGVPIISYAPAELAVIDVPNPSAHSMATLGTPSVAEAAAILAGGTLLKAKRVVGGVIVATGGTGV